jgi:PAS domain S-box-containing protein
MEDTAVKILLVEDDEIDALAFERFVKNEHLPYQYEIARSLGEARNILSHRSFDLIITDYALGDGNGFDVMKLSTAIPKIFVTGSGNESLALQALDDGALDYLVKDHGRSYLKCLPAAISSALRQRHMECLLDNFKSTVGTLVSERDRLLETLEDMRRGEHEQRVRERLQLGSALQSLEKVLGFVSHELRTPLAGIRAMVEFLISQEVRNGSPGHNFLHSIQQATIRMNSTVSDLLEVARLNSGVARWNWSLFSLHEVCSQAVASILPLIQNSEVKLSFQVEPSDLSMMGDQNAVCRLLINLLSNAHKHTSAGSISLSCAENGGAENRRIVFRIQDTGAGISKEALPKLGKAFSLNAGTVSDDFGRGIGLGLTICKGIVAAHGGRFEIDSELGKGTCVTTILNADMPGPVELSTYPENTDSSGRADPLSTAAGVNEGKPDVLSSPKSSGESQLRKANTFLERVIDHLPLLVFIKNPDLTLRYWNRLCEEVLGIPREEILGKTGAEAFSKPEMEAFFKYDRQALETKQIVVYEETVAGANGPIHLLTHKAPVLDNHGTIIALIGICEDVTNRRRSEQKIAQQAALLDKTRDAIIVRTSDSRVIYWNHGATALYGWTAEEMLGQRTRELLYSDPETFDTALELLRQRKEAISEQQQLTKSRHNLIVECRWTLVPGEEGAADTIFCIHTDVTARKLAERALRDSEERYELSVRGSGAGLWDHNLLTGEVIYSPRVRELLGYSVMEFPNEYSSLIEALHPADRGAVLQGVEQHLHARRPYNVEFRLRTKTGEYRWFNARGQALWDAAGKAYRMAGSISDVTGERQRRILESETISLRDSLLSHRRILNILSQELRTPLAGIRAIAELLLQQGEAGEKPDMKFLDTLRREVVNLGETVGDFLEVVRLNTNQVKWNWSRVPASLPVEAALENTRTLIDAAAVELQFSDESGGSDIHCDPEALARMLKHLLKNSAKHTEKGKILIELSHDGPGQIIIQVSDTGSGIPAAVQERIGSIGNLNSGLLGENYINGSGLGLAVCHGIAAAHGGHMTITSNLGSGTVVRIWLRTDLTEPLAANRNIAAEELNT